MKRVSMALRLGCMGLLGMLAGCFRMPDPEPVVNPSPVEKHRMVLTLEQPLPEGAVITASVDHKIYNNRDCLPVDYGRALGGITPDPYVSAENPAVEAISDTRYEFSFFSDYFVDQEYHDGRGACDWQPAVPAFRIAWHGMERIAGLAWDGASKKEKQCIYPRKGPRFSGCLSIAREKVLPPDADVISVKVERTE